MSPRAAPSIGAIVLGTWATAVAAAEPLTEREFLAGLTEDHPAHVALREELAAATGERRAPRTENPALAYEREAADGEPSQDTWTLSWKPPLDGRRGLANRAAEAGQAAAEHRFERRRLEVRQTLRELFARWALSTDRRDLLAELARRTGQLAARARARAESGEESGLNAGRLELAAASARGAAANAEADLLRARAEVGSWFPELAESVTPARPPLPDAPMGLEPSARPDVRAREMELEQAELERRFARRFVEFPSLVGGWTRIDDEAGAIEGPVFGVEWDVPLFDRGQGERARAQVDADAARARLAVARARAEAELDAADDVYARLRAAAVDGIEVTDGSDALLEAAGAEFEAGEASLTDLLETLRSVTDSRLAALDIYGAALAAHRELELAVGKPLTEGETP